MSINATEFLKRKRQYIRRKRGSILDANLPAFHITTCNISPVRIEVGQAGTLERRKKLLYIV